MSAAGRLQTIERLGIIMKFLDAEFVQGFIRIFIERVEHYKSNFEDTKSDVCEVAEKNTEIMSHMIIITELVILCVVVFVVSARSWSIHRGLLQFDAGIQLRADTTNTTTHRITSTVMIIICDMRCV